tara:strand:- start:184 stop:447 length:264 start_codon:yes stop_codon:yes gene_type:complete
MNIPTELTIDQIKQMRAALKANKKVTQKQAVKKYMKSSKGKKAVAAAASKYYLKKKKERLIKEIQDKIDKTKLQLADFEQQLLEQEI